MRAAPAFEVREPEEDSPVLVEVPHAGLGLDPEALAYVVAPARSIARDADLYVDEIFADAPASGASLLAARMSRYLVDLNRAEDDYDGRSVVGGPDGERPRGVVWRLSSEGAPVLREPLPRSELERRTSLYYRPYHAALRALLDRKRRRFGFAVLLCAHSMPSPRPRAGRPMAAPATGPDVVPGTRGRTTAAARWIDRIERVARDHHLGVQHDVPYRGGFTTAHYGRPSDAVHAVQLEVARRLYMNEETLGRAEGYENVRAFAREVVRELVAEARRAGEERGGDGELR
jgi:N-formylglutamate amidohydrolase